MSTTAYYNEFEPSAAAWLEQLIDDGLIPYGEVDTRSIKDVEYSDLLGYSQHHFFAGIGGWSYALRLAGWPDDKPVWTGSCPCQPFSAAGNRKGRQDDRHLWPEFYRLIRKYEPDTIFGEQVEGAIKHGWLDDLQTDLEREGYAVGHCVLGAHSVNAAHIRQRLYWVGHASGDEPQRQLRRHKQKPTENEGRQTDEPTGSMQDSFGVANSQREGLQGYGQPGEVQHEEGREEQARYDTETGGRVGDPEHDGHVTAQKPGSAVQTGENGREEEQNIPRESSRASAPKSATDISGCEEQGAVEWLYCRDGKHRPIKSGIKPLVDGLPKGMVYSGDPSESCEETQEARVMRLKGYGNAIVPQVAAEFIKATRLKGKCLDT